MVLGAICLVVYMQRFEEQASGGALVPIVVAARDLPLGTVLTEQMLGVRDVPERYVDGRHTPAPAARRVLGIRVSTQVRASESVLWTDLANYEQGRDLSSLVREGMRAVTIHADPASSFGGLLRPGDRVDVLLTTERSEQRTTSSILQNVLVLATGRDTGGPRTGEEGGPARVLQITLAVTPDQSQTLALAEAQGTLTLALRNPEDITIIEG